MKIESAKDFFNKYISVASSIVSEDYRLTWKEIEFLVECCIYNYEGNDLNNLDELSIHMLSIGFFTRKTDISMYKCKLGIKKWAITGRNIFKLRGVLDSKKGDIMTFKLDFDFQEEV